MNPANDASTDSAPAANTEDASKPSPWASRLTTISMLIGLIAFAITMWIVGPVTLWRQLVTIGPGFAVILAIQVLITLCDAAALSGFLGSAPSRATYGQVVKAQVAGRAINAVTPFGSLGEATKATSLMQTTSSDRAIAAVVRYNVASTSVQLVFVAIGCPLCAAFLTLPRWMTIALLIGSVLSASAVVAGILLMRRGLFVTLLAFGRTIKVVSHKRFAAWQVKAKRIDAQLAPARKKKRRISWSYTSWLLLSSLLSLTSSWTVLAFSGHIMKLGTMAAISTAGEFIGIVSSLVPMGLGVSEGGNASLFGALGESPALGVTLVMGGRVTTLVYAAIGFSILVTSGTANSARVTLRAKRKVAVSASPSLGRGGN